VTDLKGRKALVTGAAIRVGRAIALELGRAGADVAVHCHTHRSEADAVAAEISRDGRRAVVVQGDLSSAGEVARVFAEVDATLGPPDILVSNAAIFERRAFGEISEAQLRRMLDVNLVGPFLCAQEATRRMRGREGDIVHVLDIGGTSLAWKGYAHYCASKAGLAMLTRVLASELAPGIRVNAVAPGAILFPAEEDEEARARAIARVPMGRSGNPEDVAQAVRFLIGGPRYITGQIVSVDGGRTAAG
jgi:NAD(P)-dependent dehydrogenase (short-subunit alcohol dehydrogenase family)